MDRDHKIRLAIRGLAGETRVRAIDKLLRYPSHIKLAIKRRSLAIIDPHKHKSVLRAGKRNKHGKRVISWNMRLTPEEYLMFRDKAVARGVSMAKLFRMRVIQEE